MESKNKKSKKNQENEEEYHDLDRLSALPDSILSHILSFLDTRSAIRTSVLSERYRLLWTLSQCLDFTLWQSQSVVSFESYVNRVLRLREPSNLTKFRISLHRGVSSEFMQNCVDYAARHRVEHLRIRGFLATGNPVTLPNLLLTSSSLITLHLHNAIRNSIELPMSVSLQNLKTLRLKSFEFSDWNFNGEVFSGCPNLETLVLGMCSIRPANNLKILDVNCLNLKNLEIRHWRSPWRCFDEHIINVRAPKLAFFLFQGHLARVNFDGGLSCMEIACIDLLYPTACFSVNVSERKQRTSEGFFSMLRQLCNVEFLSVSLKTAEVMAALPDLEARTPTIFENLSVLEFTDENGCREKRLPIHIDIHPPEIATDVMIFDFSKQQDCSNGSLLILLDLQKSVIGYFLGLQITIGIRSAFWARTMSSKLLTQDSYYYSDSKLSLFPRIGVTRQSRSVSAIHIEKEKKQKQNQYINIITNSSFSALSSL
ncbi:hypothetical protein DH2020_049592 [Rehmannia glutinosa]|uniref:F-box domain-containing protein n=1 Tax=Rehmannia glutinosa TaxID=99300 RepID=A0ABR0U2D9_REHGL